MATATTLTWKSALEVAERVYKSKEPLCINAKFQADTNLSHKATFEQLQKKLASLAVTKADEPTKKRVMVILGLTNPAKKEDGKGAAAKPKTLADFKKAAIEASKSEKVSKVNPKQLARQKQIELSLVLFANDFMKFNAVYLKIYINEKRELTPYAIKNLFSLVEKSPDLLAFFLLHFKFFTNNQSDPKIRRSLTINLYDLPDHFFEKLKDYASHPDPEVRKITDNFQKAKEIINSPASAATKDRYQTYWGQVCAVCSNSENIDILKRLYPDFIQAVALHSRYLELKNSGHYDFESLIQSGSLHNDSSEQEFLRTYERLFQELHQIQKEHFSSQKDKEYFLQRYNRSREEIHPQGANTSFPTPEELRNPSLKKKQEEKEKPKADAVSMAADSFRMELPKYKEPRASKKKQNSKIVVSSQVEPTKAEEPAKAKPAKSEDDRKAPPKASLLQGIFAKRNFPYEQVVYDSRVKSWDVLKKESPVGFTEDAVWKHSCAPILEKFLGTSYSFRDLWIKPGSTKEDPCFCIIADVTSRDGNTIPGVFQFTFDDKGVCYHRWFGRMSNIKRLDKVINQRRQEISFPPLRKPQKPHVEELDQISFEIDPFFGSITFDDEENGLKIKIYKVEE